VRLILNRAVSNPTEPKFIHWRSQIEIKHSYDNLSTSHSPFTNMIGSSSLKEHNAENMAFGTPSKSRVTTVGNEENQENMINSCERHLSTPSKRDSGIEAPSTVSARREWLSQFGKKSVNHYQSGSNNNRATSESNKSSTVETSASKGKRPMTSTVETSASKGKRTMTSTMPAASSHINRLSTAEPVKRNFTPRKKKVVKHSGVEATDDGVASVRKLSQWLSNDPTTSKKKAVNVPRGRHVSYKSRNFERGQENVIVRENHIQRGSVTDKKNWLKKAFHPSEEEEQVDELTSRLNRQYAKSEVGVYDPSATRYAQSEIVTSRPSNMSVSVKKDWLKKAFKSAADASREEKKQEEEPRSVIITDDAASSLSVSDKKNWLQGAFKKTEGTPSKKTGAASDIMHCRGESRDEIAARAKRKFLQRSASGRIRTPGKSTPVKTTTPVKHTPTQRRAGFELNVLGSQSEGRVDMNPKMEPKLDTTMNFSENFGSIVEPKRTIAVEEDRTPVDFRAARDLLVQRGLKNGNRIKVQHQVEFKKTKYQEN
jgi:hypothetical protein